MNKITIIDSTLRDGSHAISHQFTKKVISSYAQKAQESNLPILVVGHGNGLGASSEHLGSSLISDGEMLVTAGSRITTTKLAAFLIPGFGTIRTDLAPAIEVGVQTLIVACHCTEATVTRQHIQYAKSKKLQTFGVLMMSHMITVNALLEQAKLMESYGVDGVILMDSAGAHTMQTVKEKVGILVKHLGIPVGFHAHNNLGLAVANSLTAVESGATIIDGTARGLGAGAGNCPLDVIVALLHKQGYETGVELYPLMDAGEYISTIVASLPQITTVTLASGLAGVFSGFAPHVVKASEVYGVDVRDILAELGRRQIVAGQEDMIIEVAKMLGNSKQNKPKDFQLESLT